MLLTPKLGCDLYFYFIFGARAEEGVRNPPAPPLFTGLFWSWFFFFLAQKLVVMVCWGKLIGTINLLPSMHFVHPGPPRWRFGGVWAMKRSLASPPLIISKRFVNRKTGVKPNHKMHLNNKNGLNKDILKSVRCNLIATQFYRLIFYISIPLKNLYTPYPFFFRHMPTILSCVCLFVINLWWIDTALPSD